MPHTTECLVPEDLLQHIINYLEAEWANAVTVKASGGGPENIERYFDDVPATIAELKQRLAD